ncbi:Putative Heat shock protein 70 family [Colletotrichum destructivum]|uniref:Heat shock protein 70 family n=1 Tax=Colletotrichum destructivum TaxID=34406 RepID=A0AAX4I1X2_9PEZI|nr:Putative Heat shock protein 70 family [Colletotrichum destructivum]
MAGKEKEHVIVVGIDFGTTFSGVSWAYSGQPDVIEVITRWETELNFASDTEKTPTAILFQKSQGEVFWGSGIPLDTDQEPLKWFKLLLVDEGDLPPDIQHSSQIATAKALAKAANKDSIEIISSYLRLLWNHSMECIGISAGEETVKLCRFHVVITLPAIWPDYAKTRMRRAAEYAGITHKRPVGETTLAFISEPEAAALATTKDVTSKPLAKEGDYFVVCDAGGGTVDLISYEITKLSPTVVREAIKGDGGLCGAVFLDEGFLNLIKKKVTPAAWAMVPNEEAANMLNCDWENGIKKRYEGQEGRTWNFRLPPECQIRNGATRGIKRKRNLMLGHSDLHQVFDPIAKKIGNLIQKQIDGVLTVSGKMPKTVILVGGFGRSRYIHNYVKSMLGDGITLLQSSGTKPWTAICRGATLQGLASLSLSPHLAVSVRSRISRASYGLEYYQKFDPALHNSSDKSWYQQEQDWCVGGNMKWFLKQGMDISNTQPVRHEYYRLYSSAPKNITDTFYVTATSPAPKRQTSDVKKLCDVTWNKAIDFETLPRFTNSLGKVFGKLEYTVEMTCAGAGIDFTVLYNGKHVCSKNVDVDFEGGLTKEQSRYKAESK